MICGRQQAQATGKHSPVTYQAVPKPKLMSIGFSQRNWKILVATARQKGTVNSETCPSTSRMFDDTEVVMKLAEQYDGDMFLTTLEDAEQTLTGTKKIGLTISRSTDKPRMEYFEDQHGTIIFIRALQGHSHGFAINPQLFSLRQIPLTWKVHTGTLPTTNQSFTVVSGQEDYCCSVCAFSHQEWAATVRRRV